MEPPHNVRRNFAAGAAGDVVKDAGDVDRVRRLGEMAVHALGVGLVVIGGDQQQRVGTHVLILDALFDLGGGAVGTAAHDDGHPASHPVMVGATQGPDDSWGNGG